MCAGIAVARSELPLELIDTHGLSRRIYDRGGEKEIRFLWRDGEPLLPVWTCGRLCVERWGCRARRSRLPPTGWTWRTTVEAGGWGQVEAEPVEIPASFALSNGIWYAVKEAIRGVRVLDERGEPAVYLMIEPASHYFRVMTRAEWMPVLVGEVI
ncbi:MAG: hypothetical protein K2X87_03470 [Gemmataceae bacterium]|nr:hypothetical protein [Gemmataceae bacterium]